LPSPFRPSSGRSIPCPSNKDAGSSIPSSSNPSAAAGSRKNKLVASSVGQQDGSLCLLRMNKLRVGVLDAPGALLDILTRTIRRFHS
ncbi:hypothetical protein AVEN_518-1, partial [Araneus ventricosus]